MWGKPFWKGKKGSKPGGRGGQVGIIKQQEVSSEMQSIKKNHRKCAKVFELHRERDD